MRRAYLVLAAYALFAAGCSPHETPPATPVDTAATPTNRSFTKSTDQPNTPFYTQPGVNPGKIVTLKPIPSQAGYSPNTPLASKVHDALLADTSLDSRYVAIATKGNSVMLIGTVSSAAAKSQVEKIAKKLSGVGGLVDKLSVTTPGGAKAKTGS